MKGDDKGEGSRVYTWRMSGRPVAQPEVVSAKPSPAATKKATTEQVLAACSILRQLQPCVACARRAFGFPFSLR
jgi:hypothetical protein